MVLTVGAAGFLGAILRFLVSRAAARLFSANFPVGTLAANWLGSLCTGLFAGVLGSALDDPWRTALLAGFLGGFTTFSTFTYETVLLWESGDRRAAVANALLNVVGGTALALVGMVVT